MYSPPPPLPPSLPAPKASWWSRNWKWFVPVICVGGVLVFVGFAAVIVNVVFGMMKSSDAYKEAVARAKTEPAVIQALGEPISEGFVVTGNIHVSGPSGNAELSIPISGPKGEATIYVEATKELGKWTINRLVVENDKTGDRIEIVPEPFTNKAP